MVDRIFYPFQTEFILNDKYRACVDHCSWVQSYNGKHQFVYESNIMLPGKTDRPRYLYEANAVDLDNAFIIRGT